MSRRREAFPDTLAAAVADGATIDWRAVETTAAGANAELIRQLRIIAELRNGRGIALPSPRSWVRDAALATFGVGVVLAAIKVVPAFLAAIVALARGALPAAAWPFAFNLAIFGVGGLLMVVGGGRDRRLQFLGGFYLTIAVSFVGPFQTSVERATGPLGVLLTLAAPEAFLPLGIWLFAFAFPAEPSGRRARRAAAVAILVATFASVVAFASMLVLEVHYALELEPTPLISSLRAFDRQAPRSLYWPLTLGLALLAIPFMVVKSRRESRQRRRQVAQFLGALAFGLIPVLVAPIATPFVPALREPAVLQIVGIVVYGALASIVPLTAYAVAVNHVMDWQLVVRAALRYALARYAIRAAILAPLTYLSVDVFLNRGLTILEYLDAQRPVGLLAFSGLGLVALTFRPQLVAAVDRWFQREPLDPSLALSRLEQRFRDSEHLRDLSAALGDELASTLHAERAAVLLLADDGGSLVALDGDAPSLPRHSVLVDLLRSTRSELHLDAASTLVGLLPDPDQDWLTETGATMLAPLLGSSGDLLGLAAITKGTDGVPYTDRHTAVVTAMCSQAALQLENRQLRQTQVDRPRVGPVNGGVSWRDEPATWCPSCLQTWSPETRRCRCGVTTKPAVLPLFVNGKFRLQRVLGTGGSGVVYLATDLALDRQVALKTLPPIRREYAARLRREAKAMAAVRHPNLATIFGAEEWRDTPLLVVEYLEGGTLLDALRAGPLPFAEVLDLGIMLADALDRVHGSGVLHRDIKPSNIGYTADGVPKLLDFGLAAMLDSSKVPGAAGPVAPVRPTELMSRFGELSASSTLTVTLQVVGTPLYLSPEALVGSSPTESFDLWSLAMVLYEALAGRHPFGGRAVPAVIDAIQHEAVPDLRDLRPECPAPVAAYLADALSVQVSRRPVSAAALRTGLRELQDRLDTRR